MRQKAMATGCVLVAALAAGYLTGLANPKTARTQEPQATEGPIPAADAAKTIPVKPTPEGLAAAK